MLTVLSPKTRPVHSKAITQIKELQRLLMAAANEDNCTGPALAQIARAWSELEERKRILQMKPAPKPIEVQPKKHKHKPLDATPYTPLVIDSPSPPTASESKQP